MKQTKGICHLLLLLLWAALLCLSVSLRAHREPYLVQQPKEKTATAEISQETGDSFVAWLEEAGPQLVPPPIKPALPALILSLGLLFRICTGKCTKPREAIRASATLSERFRILPNAP
ncbi:hypothetical protein [Pontibacter ummariensis]|uniref:hypothetical protein n=1 Tax=Pontibacter ummariensis TaxID=1610492 RepID=UPI000B77EB18|nr:hypothetical protein [Pontibacter ummariensis]